MAKQHGACEHLYLAGNCPYCTIVSLRKAVALLHAERERLADRLDAARLMHMAAIAERDDALAQIEQHRTEKQCGN